MTRIVFVNSFKGGVGKTYTTMQIVKMLRDAGNNVTVMDLDITTPNVTEMDGVKVARFASTRIPTKTHIVNFIRSTVKSLENDSFLVIDTPPTMSDTYLAVAETVKYAMWIFVSTPDRNSIKDTKIGINFFVNRGVMPAGVVQNMVGVFGDKFDSVKELGVETLAVVTKDNDSEFEPLLDAIVTFDFKNTKVTEKEKKIFESSYTPEYVKAEIEKARGGSFPSFPLRFYNLETWEVIRDELVAKDSMNSALSDSAVVHSYFDITTKKLEPIVQFNEGDKVSVLITKEVHVVNKPVVGSIMEAAITYENKLSKGLPMFILNNGVNLWVTEADLIEEEEIQNLLNDGYKEIGEGTIVPNTYSQLYYNRVMAVANGFPIKEPELEIIKTCFETAENVIAMVSELEDNYLTRLGDEPFTIDGYKEFIEEQIADGVDYSIDGGMLKHVEDIESMFSN